MAPNDLFCADEPLRNYSLTHSRHTSLDTPFKYDVTNVYPRQPVV